MTPTLRPYQNDLVNNVYDHWQRGSVNNLVVLPTGGGKTIILSHIVSQHQGHSCVIAHRQELVSQLSLSLGKFGVRHRIVAPRNVIRDIIGLHRAEFGQSFYDPNAPTAVAGIDTLKTRIKGELAGWARQVTLWVTDEAHHLLRHNKWGAGVDPFTNARGLGVTATPERPDGFGLGRHADGVFNCMIEGPTMRQLIEMGNLTDYDVAVHQGDFNADALKVTQSGDFSPKQMREASKESHIVGDVVEQYIKHAGGKRGITFATDVETAVTIAQRYKDAGIRAEAVSAKTSDHVRADYIKRFRDGRLEQLVNVDLFGEGFDVPAVEVVSMARPTMSIPVYMQQFGRALRPCEGKERALVIDHVGNVKRHNLPDIPRLWSLDGRDKASRGSKDPDEIPLTTCKECFQPYERVKPACPYCGAEPIPEGNRGPKQVDGDLVLLDPNIMAEIRASIEAIDRSPADVASRAAYTAGPIAGKAAANRHHEKQQAQWRLRAAIDVWGAMRRGEGMDDREAYRRFYHRYKIDVLSAQALGRKDAEELSTRIEKDLC